MHKVQLPGNAFKDRQTDTHTDTPPPPPGLRKHHAPMDSTSNSDDDKFKVLQALPWEQVILIAEWST